MAISSNALFHYTDKLEKVESILQKGFHVSLCQEAEMAIPMVSFCDIPLSNAKYYLNNYGYYAIGMKLEWAIRNKLNPVLYVEKNSYLNSKINGALGASVEINNLNIMPKELIEHYDKISDHIVEAIRFEKPFSGELIRNGELIEENYKFYNEREWRYIPDKTNEYFPLGLSREEYQKFKVDNPTKPHFKEHPLIFGANDIKYILIKDESEISNLIDFLMSVTNLGSANDIQKLFPKILIANHLIEDF